MKNYVWRPLTRAAGNKKSHRPGIYMLRSLSTNKLYIGSSVNISCRVKEHNRCFVTNTHNNKRMQNFVNKYGVDDLVFAVIAYCSAEHLLELEQEYMDKWMPYFNICKNAGSCLGVKRSPEIIEMMRNRMIGKKQPHVAEANRKRKGTWKFPESGKEKISKANKNKKKPHLVIANKARKGVWKFPEEGKRKLSTALKGQKRPHLHILNAEKGIAFSEFIKKLVGTNYHYLTVVGESSAHNRKTIKCECVCGRICHVLFHRLNTGGQKSCGCKGRKSKSLSKQRQNKSGNTAQ